MSISLAGKTNHHISPYADLRHLGRGLPDKIAKNLNGVFSFHLQQNFIITARYDTIDPLHKFAKMFEVNEVLEKRKTEVAHAGTIFYWMMRELYQSLHDELSSAHDMLNDIQVL